MHNVKMTRRAYSIFFVAVALAGILFFIGANDAISAYAQMPQEPPDTINIILSEPPTPILIADVSGNVIGEGEHTGQVRCNFENCSLKTQLVFTSPTDITAEYEYKFSTRQAVDLEARRVIIQGRGSISDNGQKEKFSFTVLFQDNGDGTLSVSYTASRPDASFLIPNSPGILELLQH